MSRAGIYPRHDSPRSGQQPLENHTQFDGAGLFPNLGAAASPRQDQRRMLDLPIYGRVVREILA